MTVQNNMKQNKTNFLAFYRFVEQKQFCTTVMEPANFEMTVQNYIEPFPKQYKTNFFLQKQFCATVMQPLNIQQFNVSQKHFCTTVMQPANKTFCLRALGRKCPISTTLQICFHQLFLDFLLSKILSNFSFQLTPSLPWRPWWGTATTRGSRTSRISTWRLTSLTPTSPWTTTSMERSVNLLCGLFSFVSLSLQGSKKNDNMRISQLRKVIFQFLNLTIQS